MFFDRTHSILAVLATLAFTAMLTLPCFCATAMAQTQMENETEERCPCSEDEHDGEHGDCCCGCSAVSPIDDDSDLRPSGGVVMTQSESDHIESPSSWWSPDLIVAIWLANRLAEVDVSPHFAEAQPPGLRPDLSDTYLHKSTFLI